ncbi:branched-chain amino acid ABC transporter permease [Bosea minatitlanensis]|uniref:Branched-chain amino acid ABC transporter permease n=1 Tax=Bosea minatitlanensis TaxID=128782 RepID=A0ABW0F518_9HYPH|nr:branched-chain amino acid ABC transporter permease [Bosea minatitlanensis]MCT4495267.1 branched-chain amino acid ABC transporter permease [Bosea minatitlanensis]
MEFGIFLEDAAQALATGILVGGAYALMCVGLGIIFGSMRVINFAQGDFMMLGMYATYYLATSALVGVFGLYAGPAVAALLSGPILFAFGWLLHKTMISRVTGARVADMDGGGGYAQLILTLGIGLVLQNGGLILFGSTPIAVLTPLSRQSWEVGTVLLNQARVVAFVAAIGIAALVNLFLTYSRIGRGLRAAADNPVAATYMGVDVTKAHRIAFSLGVAVTAVAGGLLASSQSFQPYIGIDFVIVMYAGVVLGGLGSIMGAFWGGLTIGLVQQLSTLFLPYQLQNTTIFLVFLLIIFFWPQGMFGRVSERT